MSSEIMTDGILLVMPIKRMEKGRGRENKKRREYVV